MVLAVVAIIAGFLAAILPARRAAWLSPLTALAYEWAGFRGSPDAEALAVADRLRDALRHEDTLARSTASDTP